jgi:hypothetical protein
MPKQRATRVLGALLFAAALLAVATAQDARARAVLSKAYAENSAPPGGTLLEKLSTVSQLDALPETTADSARSSCAATLSAYLLLGGDFAVVARRFEVGTKLTYENLHRVQEALYRHADRDGEPGVWASAQAEYDSVGTLTGWSMRGGDEYHRVLEALNMEAECIYGPTADSLEWKGGRLTQILAEDSTALFLVGVVEDLSDHTSHAMAEGVNANHYTLALWHAGAYHELDSWRPLGQSGLVRWSELTAEAMLLRTKNVIYRLWRR